MARTKSSKAWLAEHFSDEYVRRARELGYRSRAVFKLQEIDQRDHLLRPGMTVVDLGAAPGGWTQFVLTRVGPSGRVVALDILPMDSIPGVDILEGDFTESSVLGRLEQTLAGRPVDLVISDMAPNISGIGVSDQARAIYLAELALDFAAQHLAPGGQFLMKVFQGQGFSELYRATQRQFERVVTRKPKASRARSAEVYVVGKGYKPS
jgi:23S rRNA (uridine2552-2'-O)-methyltransferase